MILTRRAIIEQITAGRIVAPVSLVQENSVNVRLGTEMWTYDEDTGISWVERTEARLLEVSLTPTQAYAGAKVALVRSREPHVNGSAPSRRRSAEVDALRRYLEKIKR